MQVINEQGVNALNELKNKLAFLRKTSGFGEESLSITSEELGTIFTDLEDLLTTAMTNLEANHQQED